MEHWLQDNTWLGNSALAWLIAAIAALVGYLIVFGLAKFLARHLRALADRHAQRQSLRLLADMLAATRGWIVLLLAVAIALRSLPEPVLPGKYTYWVIIALIGIQAALWVNKGLIGWLKRATPEGGMANSNPIIFGILTWTIELVVWTTLLLILLSQAGVHIGAFVASIGVGGIAIAMAAKNVLEDLFASLAIGLDKPFEVGEFIGFGSELGTIRKVGIKSTRIESLSGEELAINNSNLLQQLVHNYSRRAERRVVFGFHVPLDTSRDNIASITSTINGIIEGESMARLDRGHFLEISSEGFRFEFVYYVLSPDFGPYADLQQSLNFKIMDAMAELDVAFALPTRVVHALNGNATDSDD